MTFASPALLWSLLAILPLIGIYFLKVRPRPKPATAFFLWEKVFDQRRENRLWHRLRSLWSLLMMLAVFVAIAFALAEPRFGEADRQDLLILVDNSTSMQTDVGRSTRLGLAKAKARDLVRALDGVQRAAVASVGDQLNYHSYLTDNPRELIAAIDKIEPSFSTFRLESLPQSSKSDEELETENDSNEAELIDEPDSESEVESNPIESTNASAKGTPKVLATAVSEKNKWLDLRRVILITDGVLAGKAVPDDIELVLLEHGKQPNVGITAADMQFMPGSLNRLSFYYQIASSGNENIEADFLVYHQPEEGPRRLSKVIPLNVAPGLNEPQVLTIEDAEPGRWIAELDLEDSLSADNTAWMIARRPPPVLIGVDADDRFFFENSVQAFTSGMGGLQLVYENPDLMLSKGNSKDAQRSIVFQPSGESDWWKDLGEEFEVGATKVLLPDHPIVRHIDPLSISFLGARNLSVPSGSQVLIESDNGVPLLYVSKSSGMSSVIVNLDPLATQFYFSAWFPALVYSSAQHLAGQDEPLESTYPSGNSIGLSNATPTKRELLLPTGESEPLVASSSIQLDGPGFYKLKSGEESTLLASSLVSHEETIQNRDRDEAAPIALASGASPTAWLAMAAILIAIAESFLYHLRKVG